MDAYFQKRVNRVRHLINAHLGENWTLEPVGDIEETFLCTVLVNGVAVRELHLGGYTDSTPQLCSLHDGSFVFLR